MTRQIKAGSTDVSVVIRIIDSGDGTPETGVVYNTSGLDLEYRREGAASVDITEATLAALTTAHADGGFLHIGNGYYRLDLPDAAVAAGATGVLIHGTCTGMVVIGEYIELVAYDPYDAVRMGLTALPNAAAEAAGGLFTRGTGAGQINQPTNGRIDANTIAISGTTQTARDLGASVLLSPGTGTGQVSLSSGAVTVGTNNDKTGYSLSAAGVQAIWDALTSALTTVGSIGKLLVDNINATISSRLASASYTAPLDAAGTRSAVGLASANLDTQLTAIDDYLDTEVSAIKAKTDQLTFTGSTVNATAYVNDIEATALAKFITEDTGTTFDAGANPGSVVSEILRKIQRWLQVIVRSDVGIATDNTLELTELNQDMGHGTGTYDNTTDSLEALEAGGGSSDWTADEKDQIRYRLQLDGVQVAPATDAPVQLPVDIQAWVGGIPSPLIGGRVESALGSFLIDESRVDGACTEGGQTQSFTTNLTETEDDYYAGWVFMFTDAGTNRAVPRVVRLYNGTTKEITLVTPLPANTTNGHAFALIALTVGAELTDGSMELNQGYTASAVLDAEQAGFLTPGTIGESINEAATNTQDIQTRLPAALVSGRMDASVGAMQNGVVTAAAVATGAIDADALAADAVDEILDEVIEGSLTLRQALRVLLAALANKASGGGTTTITFRDLADSKARITATVDANGNRTAVTLDGS